MATIDELDVEILARLTENARVGVAELAAELGVSRTTVNLRLKRLEEDGVLLGLVMFLLPAGAARCPVVGQFGVILCQAAVWASAMDAEARPPREKFVFRV